MVQVIDDAAPVDEKTRIKRPEGSHDNNQIWHDVR